MERQTFPTAPVANPDAIIGGADKGLPYRFTVLTDGLIRYEWASDCKFEDRASTFAIHRDLPVPKFRLIESDHMLEIITARYHLRYDKQPFSASGLSVQVKGNITDWKSVWRFGGGIKEEGYKLGGTARTLDEANGRIEVGPGVIANNGYASLDDSQTMLFTDDGFVTGRRPGDRSDGYLFAYGLDYRAAMKGFFSVSGSQPLLPRWSLGNWWSRFYDYTETSYLALMDRFKAEGLPFSVGVIDMAWHLWQCDVVAKSDFSGWTGYTWEKKFFPNPKRFLDELHKRGLKCCPNDHPADGIASYEETYPELCKALGRNPDDGDPVPFDIANKAFLDAYFDIVLKKVEDDGMDFWWVDWQQGPYSSVAGVDPLWVLNHYHFLNNKRGGKRPLTFSRYAGPGSHRYPVGFSGDSVVSWESLEFQPEFTATASNIGYGNWSHDIGGHMQGYRDDELATRWVQLGVFSPILRLHSSNNPWNSKEPWRFLGDARKAMNDALRLRHRLLPYLYSMNVRSAKDDEPLVQPIYWHYPERSEAYSAKTTFYFGAELFVAPVTSKRDTVTLRSKVKAWLPPGRHVDIFSGTVYDGDRTLFLYRTLDEYAVFAKEGAIIPMDAAEVPENGETNPKGIEIKVVVGADGIFKMYEDDGHGSDIGDVKFTTTPIYFTQRTGTLTVGPVSSPTAAIPEERDWTFNFVALHDSADIKAFVDGKEKKTSRKNTQQGITISLCGIPITAKITVELGTDPQLSHNDPLKQVFHIIDLAQMDFDPKQAIWTTLTREAPLSARLSELHTLNVDENLFQAINEFMLADARHPSLKGAKLEAYIDN